MCDFVLGLQNEVMWLVHCFRAGDIGIPLQPVWSPGARDERTNSGSCLFSIQGRVSHFWKSKPRKIQKRSHHTNSVALFRNHFHVFIFIQIEVNGSNASPLYKFLKSSKGGILGKTIKWNYSKFLIDKNGNVIDRFAPATSPLKIEVIPSLLKLKSYPYPKKLIFNSSLDI